jgi:hypothetical protein
MLDPRSLDRRAVPKRRYLPVNTEISQKIQELTYRVAEQLNHALKRLYLAVTA